MITHAYVPASPLSDFVNSFWLYEGDPQPHTKERCLPTGTTELVINLRDDTLRVFDSRSIDQFSSFGGALICGPHSESFVIDSTQQDFVLGVNFKVGGAFPFFGMPADELHNVHVSLESLWGARVNNLREQLLEAKTPQSMFYVLERSLLTQAASFERHPAVAFALSEFQPKPRRQAVSVSAVTEQVGLSQRRFIQVFKEEVGLTPKLFCRIQRFQNLLSRIHKQQHVDWTSAALAWGYFDQAHFIHDFRAFSGLSPTAYLGQRSDHLNHVPLHD